jgi:hypothetical protein
LGVQDVCETADNFRCLRTVLYMKRIAAGEGYAGDMRFGKFFAKFFKSVTVELDSGKQRVCLWVLALRAMMAASGNKQGYAKTITVQHIDGLDIMIIHRNSSHFRSYNKSVIIIIG